MNVNTKKTFDNQKILYKNIEYIHSYITELRILAHDQSTEFQPIILPHVHAALNQAQLLTQLFAAQYFLSDPDGNLSQHAKKLIDEINSKINIIDISTDTIV